MADIPPPPIPEVGALSAVLDYLEYRHPLRPPDLSQSNREIWMMVGRQQILQVLRNLKAKAEEEPLPR